MEKTLVEWLKREFEQPKADPSDSDANSNSFVKLGIGDDCAVLSPCQTDLVVTCDAILDGVHFRCDEHSFQQIGRKALAVNLSDLASMAASPRAAIVSLTLPRTMNFEQVKGLYCGMRSLAEETGIQICGGDTNVWDGPLSMAVTAIGVAPETGAWTISGAKPGDRIMVTGALGGSLAGSHLSFRPRNHLVNLLPNKTIVNACTDISDSLGIDLAKIAKASGVGFELQTDSAPISLDAAKLAEASGKSPLQHALTDGEDFELLFAVSDVHANELIALIGDTEKITDVGYFTEATDYWQVASGQRTRFQPSGYEHQISEADGEAE